MPICFRFAEQLVLRADSRARFRAGSSMPARIAMIAITTGNSINVKFRRLFPDRFMLPFSFDEFWFNENLVYGSAAFAVDAAQKLIDRHLADLADLDVDRRGARG